MHSFACIMLVFLQDELGCIKTVYIIKIKDKKHELFNGVSMFRSGRVRSSSRYNLVRVECPRELHHYVHRDQLTAEFGGTLAYNHRAWADFHRVRYEHRRIPTAEPLTLITCYVMLCYVMLSYVMLCYVMLCYVMLCYVTW